jgi:hypothetical protein
MPPSLSV